MKKLQIKKFKSTIYVDFREYFAKDTQLLPTKKGVTLTVEMWKKMITMIPEVDKIIDQMEKNLPVTLSPGIVNAYGQPNSPLPLSTSTNENSNSICDYGNFPAPNGNAQPT